MPNHFHWLIKVREKELLIWEMVRRRKLNKEVLQNLRGLPEKPSKEEVISYFSSFDESNVQNLQGLSERPIIKEIKSNLAYKGESLVNPEGLDKNISTYLSQQFSNLFNGYTKAINKRYKRYGSLFAPRFKRKLVDSRDYLRQLIIYIHTNPVHHYFTKDPTDWEFSSYHEICSGKNDIVTYSRLMDLFDNKEDLLVAHRSKTFSLLNEDYKLE